MALFAEEVNYWHTSHTGPDAWLEKAKAEIKRAGGQVVGSAMVSDDLSGRGGFMLAFQIGQDRFKLTWPVLEPQKGRLSAARIQAATALYHEVKAACVKAKFLGPRAAFFGYLLLADGQTTAEVGASSLELLPKMLTDGNL